MRYFYLSDFNCTHTGKNEMKEDFLERIDEVRKRFGKPLYVSSGYRDETHPVEARKSKPGRHNGGYAVDLFCDNSADRYALLKIAFEMDFTGIAAGKGFIHLDDRAKYEEMVLPRTWVY